MSDLDPINFPARVVRAQFGAMSATARAALLADLARAQFVAALLASVIALDSARDGDRVSAALWACIVVAHVAWSLRTLRRRNRARRRAAALDDICMHYTRTRTVKAWPEESR